ncbi:MAG TPA: FtsK/SpoIIIE domain-containing protein, partial [Jatrophihabitans sp.]|nr:FtsK/SpoIIIE domain-containing protein [Jatrophihabitans sp.]
MHVDLSLATGDGFRDLRVTAPAAAALPELLPAMAAAAGLEPGARLWLDGHPLDAGRFDDGRLRTGALLDVRPRDGTEAPGLLSLQVVGGPSAGQLRRLERGSLVVGRDAGCDLVLSDPDVSRRHAEIAVDGSITVRDLGSTNGTYLDGVPVGGRPVELAPGVPLRLGDSLLVVAGPDEAPADTRPGPDGTRHVLRPPAPAGLPPAMVVELPVREAAASHRGVQWLGALLPAAAGAGLAWYAGSPQFLLFALLSPVMLLSTALGDRLHWRRARRRAAARFRQELAQARARIAEGLRAETAARRLAAPDPATLLRIAGLPGVRLWSRTGDDRLRVRVGTGELPSSLVTRTGNRSAPAGRLGDVPVELDLGRGPVGLAGPGELVDPLAAWLVAQVAAHHSPAGLELAFLLDARRSAAWSWARWLPHLRARVARSADEWPALLEDLGEAIRHRRASPHPASGWLVVVADRAAELADRPGWAAVLAAAGEPALRVAVLCVETAAGRLPVACRTVALATGETGTRWRVRDGEDHCEAVGDGVSPEWCERFARALAPLVDGASEAAAVPGSCGLRAALELPAPSAESVAARWRRAGDGAATVLGAAASGLLPLDLAAEGPHALVAGTTGAGKSELLQALVAGLAANHPPDALTLLLIDYKGGAAFAECARLPHTAGLVTDLDPYLTERALRSLDAELRRRERLLAGAGAPDLPAYRAGKPFEPLPRLVIVVDEFATLADELPDFVRGLVGVAQRGRSLGVHLVLATQRPGRAVSPEIRANTALRICLRVTDPAESSDVIGTPEAALIERGTPGRGYLRSGSGLTMFQAAHPAGRTSTDPDRVDVTPLGPWRRPVCTDIGADGPTDLARLVTAISEAATRTGTAPAATIWQPPLPERLAAELGDPPRPSTVRLARVDRPEQLTSEPLELDLTDGGSLLVAGTARSGRTQTLAGVALAAAAQLSPADLAIHVVDPGGALCRLLAPLPHLATSLGPESSALAPRLLGLLTRLERAGTDLLLVDGW